MLPYIFHVSLLISLSYLLYRGLWEKETFFQLNRWVLLLCLFISFVLPWMPIHPEWTWQHRLTKQVDISERPIFFPSTVIKEKTKKATNLNPTGDKEAANIPIVKKEKQNRVVATSEDSPQTATTSTINATNPIAEKEMIPIFSKTKGFTFWQILLYIYFAGLAIFSINFLIQLLLIIFQRATNPVIKDGRFTIVEMNQDKAPFSFGNYIFINPTKYEWDTYNQILDHEKIHIQERHTLDILLAELVVIVQWFNPFAWMYRKAVENNLEFLTDFQMLNKGTERETYQLNLLRVSVPQMPLNLTTNYNQSFLKKRIAMMNVKKSSASSSWKYLLLLPLLALTVITLNPIKLIAETVAIATPKIAEQTVQPKPKTKTKKKHQHTEKTTVNGKTTTKTVTIGTWSDENGVETINGDFHMDINEDGIYMSAAGEEIMDISEEGIHINTTTSTSRSTRSGDNEMESEDENFSIHIDENGIQIGNNKEGINISEDNFSINFGSKKPNLNGDLSYTDDNGRERRYKLDNKNVETLSLNSDGLRINGSASFEDDNIIVQNGKIDIDGRTIGLPETGNWVGDIEGRETCLQLMHSRRYNNYNISRHICFDNNQIKPNPSNNTSGPYAIKREAGELELKGAFEGAEGYGKYTFVESENFQNVLKKEGFNSIDKDLFFHLFLADINQSYFSFLRKNGYINISTRDLESLAHHNMSQAKLATYIDGLKRMNFDKPSLEELIELAVHDVSISYIQKMGRDLFNDLSIKQVVEASIHDVDPDYIQEIKNLGYKDLSFEEIIEFAIHDIDVDFVQELKSSGLNLTKKEIVEAAIHDVDADYIKEIRALVYTDLSFREMIEYAIHDIDADYIYELKSSGLDLSKKQIVEAAIHDVDADFIKEVQALGYPDITFKDIVEFSIHDVDARYIKSLKEAGLKDLSKRQIVEASIHDIDADFLKEIAALGFTDISFQEVVQLGIHDVDSDYIEEFIALGYKDLSAKDFINASIHDVDPRDVRAFNDLGFENIPIQQLIELEIHDVTPSYIRRVRREGAAKDLSLSDYIRRRIRE